MENVVDLRLIGVMTCLAYFTCFFVGDSFNPFASSRRQLRSLRLGYARALALVLIVSPAVTLWMPSKSVADGILWSLAAALVPMVIITLGFGIVAFRRLRVRRRERLDPDFRARDELPTLTLDQLQEASIDARSVTAVSPETEVLSETEVRPEIEAQHETVARFPEDRKPSETQKRDEPDHVQ